MMQHSFFLCKCLHPADVGAVSDRPRAINNRPYEFYCRFCVFCNTPGMSCLENLPEEYTVAFTYLAAFF